MNGAEALIAGMIDNGVDVCFANPGTSEMHFVAASNGFEALRNVLCLFEGVATGAADGYGRMADKPASTLLHLGFGLSNGLANLHNARRASSPVLNIVGEHATWYRDSGSALASDVEAIAATMSDWVRVSETPDSVSRDVAAAVTAARSRGGQVATLLLPADTAWSDLQVPAATVAGPGSAPQLQPAEIEQAVHALTSGEASIIVAGGRALRAKQLEKLARIAASTGAGLVTPYGIGRLERGAGRVAIPRIPAPIDAAREIFQGIRNIILAGVDVPAAMFAYPGKPDRIPDADARIIRLCEDHGQVSEAIDALHDGIAPRHAGIALESASEIDVPSGRLTPDAVLQAVAARMPDNAIVVDESISAGRNFFPLSKGARPHDYLQLTGGALGCGIPVSLGAAIACPDRRVVNLEGDGSAMYTVQGLWTQARERLDVTTVIFSNRRYNILDAELKNVGVSGNVGGHARKLLSLDDPAIGWVNIANGMGVEARAAETAEELVALLDHANNRPGPFLIEAMLD